MVAIRTVENMGRTELKELSVFLKRWDIPHILLMEYSELTEIYTLEYISPIREKVRIISCGGWDISIDYIDDNPPYAGDGKDVPAIETIIFYMHYRNRNGAELWGFINKALREIDR